MGHYLPRGVQLALAIYEIKKVNKAGPEGLRKLRTGASGISKVLLFVMAGGQYMLYGKMKDKMGVLHNAKDTCATCKEQA